MAYVHFKKTLADSGIVIQESEIEKHLNDPEADYYTSAYQYDEEILSYYNKTIKTNKYGDKYNTVAGYDGSAFTDTLFWDLDGTDLDKTRSDTLTLVRHLEKLGYTDSLNYFFSGSKGFHVLLHTEDRFTPEETAQVCYKIAQEAGVTIDTVVYNKTRAFRIPDTKHKKTGLFKIELDRQQLEELPLAEILTIAKKPQGALPFERAQSQNLKTKYYTPIPQATVLPMNSFQQEDDFNIENCPKWKRHCIYRLENGFFGPGERENALVRLCAYYKGHGYDQEYSRAIIEIALNKRGRRYTVDAWKEEDNERILNVVFNDVWKGGMYSCVNDSFLAEHCDKVGGCLASDHKHESEGISTKRVVDINQLAKLFEEEYSTFSKSFPKIGIPWLDKRVQLRPKAFTVLNGANGSGKTSLVIKTLENLSEQKIWNFIFSMDMADTTFFLKLAARYTAYTYSEIENAFMPQTKDAKVIEEVFKRVGEALPYTLFDFSSSYLVEDMEKVIHKVKEDRGIDIKVVFVDYAGRLMGKADSMTMSATLNALAINDLCQSTKSHWVILSQISRGHGDQATPLYSNRVAKDSGEWEANATYVLNIWRPFSGVETSGEDQYMDILIGKARTGLIEKGTFFWDGKRGEIREMTAEEEYQHALQCYENEMDIPTFQNLDAKTMWANTAHELEEERAIEGAAEESDAAYVNRTSGRTRSGEGEHRSEFRRSRGSP